jgi:hypothetical protein
MINAISENKVALLPKGLVRSKSTDKRAKPVSETVEKVLVRDEVARKLTSARTMNRALLPVLCDPTSSSLSLSALVRSAAFSGKRLVVEIRDVRAVRTVRRSIRGM